MDPGGFLLSVASFHRGGRESLVFAISPVRPPDLTEASVAGRNDIVCHQEPTKRL